MTQYSQLARDLQGAAIQFTALASSASSFGASVNVFREFEKQLVLTASAAGATADEYDRMSVAAKRFSLSATSSASEAAGALYFLSQAGFSAGESLSALSGVLLLAQANLEDAGFASDVISSNIQAFGLEAQDATRIANLFTAANVNSLASLDKLAYAFRQVAPVASLAGQSIEETTTFLSELFNVGLRGEQAGTGLRNIIVRLSAPVGEARDILREFGIATVDAGGNMRKLELILQDIGKQNFGTETLSKIFGQEGLASGIALIKSVDGSYQNLLGTLTGTNDAFEIASKQIDTLDGSLKIAQNSINSIAISIGEALAPAARSIAASLSQAAIAFDGLDPAMQSTIATTGAVAISLITLVTVLGTIGPAVVTGTGYVLGLVGALKALTVAAAPKILTALSAIPATLSALPAIIASVSAGLQAATTNALLFGGAFISVVGLPAIIGAAVVAVGALAAGWLLVGTNAKIAEERQTGASRVTSLIPDKFSERLDDAIRLAQQKISSIPNLFPDEGTGPVDAASAAIGTIDTVKKQLETLTTKREELMRVANSSIEAANKNDAEYQTALRNRVNAGNASPQDLVDLATLDQLGYFPLTNVQEGEIDALNKEISVLQRQQTELDSVSKQGRDIFNKSLDLLFENIAVDPTILSSRLGAYQEQIKALFADKQFSEAAMQAVQQTADDGKVSTQEVADALIKVLSDRDKDLAAALAPESSIAKTLASLEAGQTAYEQELRKTSVTLAKRNAATMKDFAASYAADQQSVALEFSDSLQTEQRKLSKIIADALGNNSLITSTIAAVDDQGRRTVVSIPELANRTDIFKVLEQLALGGASETELKQRAEELSARSKQYLDQVISQLLAAGAIDQQSVDQLYEQWRLSGVAISNAVTGLGVGMKEASKSNDQNIKEGIAEVKRVADLTKVLATLRAESQSKLLEAQQGAARLGQFDQRGEMQRGLEIIKLQYDENVAQIEARIEKESAALGTKLSPEERSVIRQRYIDAANANKTAAEENLIRELQATGLEIQREIEDLNASIASATLAAQRTLLEKGSGSGISDYISKSLGLDQQDIVKKYKDQIRDLSREQEDLLVKYRGQPEAIAAIRKEYNGLISQLQQAAEAEIAYTNSFEAQNERRIAAIDKQIDALKESALASQDVFAQIGAGIQSSILEAQKSALNLVDFTKDAYTSLTDATASYLTDTIFDSENAFKNLGDTLKNIAQDLTKKVITNSINSIASGFLSPEQQAANDNRTKAVVDPGSINLMASTIATAITTSLSPLITQYNGTYSSAGLNGGSAVTVVGDQVKALGPIIAQAAENNKVSADVLAKIAQIESGGNPNAQNPNSSAGGLFQFTDATAKQYGLANKYDAVASAEAAARLLSDNIKYLTAALGRLPTPGEQYLAHQQGAAGAANLLRNPNASAASVVGQKAVLGNGGDLNMSSAQFAAMWTARIDAATAPGLKQGGERINAAMAQAANNISDGAKKTGDTLAITAKSVGQTTSKANFDLGAVFNTLASGLGSIGGSFLGEFGSVLSSLIGVLSGGDGFMSNIGNIFSSLFGPKVGHTGGMIKNLPYYHKGGLLADETLVVARKNEGIFTPEQMDNANKLFEAAMRPRELQLVAPKGSNDNRYRDASPTSIVINNNGSSEVSATEEKDSQGGKRITIQVEEGVASALSRPGSAARTSMKTNYGIAPRVIKR